VKVKLREMTHNGATKSRPRYSDREERGGGKKVKLKGQFGPT